jgi:hypothetical protein
VTEMGKMGKEISASRPERIRTRHHWHCSDGVGAVSGSTVRVQRGNARALGALARWRKQPGGPGQLGVGMAMGQLQSGLGCTVDVGSPVHSFFNIPMFFQFKSKAPSSNIQNMIFLLLKILETLLADRKIQIEKITFLDQLRNLSRF